MTATTEPTTTGTDLWGPLAEPIHNDEAGPGDPVWKDNAYLSFWDVERQVFGTFHLSTSPNGTGARRARCSVLLGGGEVVEVIEELEPGSFESTSISFGLDGTITVDHPDLVARLTNSPVHQPADYSLNDLIPALVPGKPLQHFQQACRLVGTFEVDGARYEIDGFGMRDRTWGFRDESAQWAEYAGLVGVFADADGTPGQVFVTAMKFLGTNGVLKADGFVIDAAGSHSIKEIGFRRTAAAQFLATTLTLDDGSVRVVTLTDRLAGFFVPMGAETDGPAFGTYDDFMQLELDGKPGAGFFEQGIVHRVH
ncbi:hypothetical protein ASE01_02870 [Nocardioides sp. Root190]|uniref:DUF7065 domain-containing protein n=1 Tax=Nocardioides sp. Root190 TaxID=1736488 RepID=UPI0006FA842E|nr:hypothetical protein [Nocardioides sp. Root190]KRB80431.1 hypothetical protein ASE01_02870 [Nocardioides sp. Root190]